jgi:site-specific recombinase XerD
MEKTPVNNQPTTDHNIGHKTPSAIQPSNRGKIQPIRHWQQRYERYLESIGRKETGKRYSRALERFLGKYPDKIYGHQFLRPVINDYVQSRLAEGASVSTVRLEMSAIRGLFQFALDMGAADVMFNPAKGVKVRKRSAGAPPSAQGNSLL